MFVGNSVPMSELSGFRIGEEGRRSPWQFSQKRVVGVSCLSQVCNNDVAAILSITNYRMSGLRDSLPSFLSGLWTRGLSLQEKVFLKSVGCESQNINNKYINAASACLDWGTCYPCFLSGFLGPGVHFYRSSVSTNLWTTNRQLISQS